MKILIVDDEPTICDLLCRRLKASGFEVAIAFDSAQFRFQAFRAKPDLIILDILLGDANGVEIYEEMLMEGLNRNIPVIFLSCLVNCGHETPALAGRKYAMYGKPLDSAELIRGIGELAGVGA